MFTKELRGNGEEVLQLRCGPFVGVLKTHGSHDTTQSVDVLRVE